MDGRDDAGDVRRDRADDRELAHTRASLVCVEDRRPQGTKAVDETRDAGCPTAVGDPRHLDQLDAVVCERSEQRLQICAGVVQEDRPPGLAIERADRVEQRELGAADDLAVREVADDPGSHEPTRWLVQRTGGWTLRLRLIASWRSSGSGWTVNVRASRRTKSEYSVPSHSVKT